MFNPGIPTEWSIRDLIKQELSSYAPSYEVSSIRSNVVSLECSVREVRSEIDGLRAQLETTARAVTDLTDIVSALLDRVAKLEPQS